MGHVIYFSYLRKANQDSIRWFWDFLKCYCFSSLERIYLKWKRWAKKKKKKKKKKIPKALRNCFCGGGKERNFQVQHLPALTKWNVYFGKWKEQIPGGKKCAKKKKFFCQDFIFWGFDLKFYSDPFFFNANKKRVIPPARLQDRLQKLLFLCLIDLDCPSCSTEMNRLFSLKVNAWNSFYRCW